MLIHKKSNYRKLFRGPENGKCETKIRRGRLTAQEDKEDESEIRYEGLQDIYPN